MIGFGFSVFTQAILGLGGGFRGSALNLDFTSGSRTLDPRVTFSRTTNATLTNSAGLVAYAPMNLLTYSEQFDNAAWTKARCTVTANSVVAPDGTTTADSIVEDTTTNSHVVFRASGITSGVTTISVYAKASARDWLFIESDTVGVRTSFNLAAGAVGTVGGIATASIQNIGDGWYRCSVSAASTGNIYFSPGTATNTNSYLGTGVTGIYIWGAQLELGSTATTYNPTTVKNLLGYTENFDNAAWTKSNASVQTNLLAYSQDFDNAAWTKSELPITPNATTAPDGSMTADKATAAAANASHSMYFAVTVTAGVTYTGTYYAKAAGLNFLQLTGGAAGFGTSQYANFDLQNGVLGTVTGGTATITSAGNGWYRCSFTVACVAPAAVGVLPVLVTSATAPRAEVFAGDGTSGIYLWGAQLVQGTSAGDYKATYAAAAAVGYTDIYGQPFAQKLVENTANGEHFLTAQAVSYISGTSYTYSCYAKAAERHFFRISFSSAAFPTSERFAYFNLAAGVVGTVAHNVTASITDVGNGWYRCAITRAATSSNTVTAGFLVVCDQDDNASYTGDGTSGIYIFGAQLSDSASVDPYVYQPVAAPSSVAYYGPRFDYDPVTLAPKGLLIEEQRTNLVLRSEEFDSASWGKANSTITANQTTAPDGSATADKITGTAASGDVYQIVSKAASAITYSWGVYVKAGTDSSIRLYLSDNATGQAIATFDLLTGAVSGVANGTWSNASAVAVNAGNGWYRCVLTATSPANATVLPGLESVGNGNFCYIWGAQLEAGAFATSYIPTVASQVTRAADSASMIGNNFARWYNQTEGTLYLESSAAGGVAGAAFSFQNDAVSNDAIWVQSDTRSNGYDGAIRTASGFSAAFGYPLAEAAGTMSKRALAYKVNDFALSKNGTTALTDTAGPLPSALVRMQLGSPSAATYTGAVTSGTIKRIAYYNRRLSNTELQGITS